MMRHQADNRRGPGAGPMTWRRASMAVAVPALIALIGLIALSGPSYADGGGGGGGFTISPSSGTTGTTVTLQGTHLPPGTTYTIGYTTSSDCSGTVTTINGATGTADGTGSVTISFHWPTTPKGSYYICAYDPTGHGHRSANPYIMLGGPPSITVTNPATSGQTVTVTGKGFLPGGGTVEVLYGGSDGCATSTGTTTVGADGTFTATFAAPFESTGTTITIAAVEPQGSCGQTNPGPTLHATAKTIVEPASVATPNPPPAPNPTIAVSTPIQSNQPVTVTGHGFLPAGTTVEILYSTSSSNGCSTHVGTVTSDASGNFTTSFTAPYELADTPITVAAVAPQGACGKSNPAPNLSATVTGTVKGSPPPIGTYCIIGLILLLLLLLLLFLLFRRRKKDEPVTIEERDRVFVPDQSGPGGNANAMAVVDRQIVARDARGREVVIAEEVTTVEEDEEDIPDRGQAGGYGYTFGQ